jgi:hypothetical protein
MNDLTGAKVLKGERILFNALVYTEDPLAGLLASRLKSGYSASFAVAMLAVDGELNSLNS